MKTSSIIKSKTAQVIAGLLIVSATVLAVTELMAEEPTKQKQSISKKEPTKKQRVSDKQAIATPTPTSTPAPFCNWPPSDTADRCRVIKAFVEALKQSTTNQTLRANLLKCDENNCTSPRDEVQKILDGGNPNQNNPNHIKIPIVIFYFDPNVPGGSTKQLPRQLRAVPHNSCYTVFSLPSDTEPPLPEHWNNVDSAFEGHLRCCYDPWRCQ